MSQPTYIVTSPDDVTIFTSPSLPAGGTTGQVLGKTSDADYAADWIDQTGGGGGGAPPSAPYVTFGTNGTLTNERVLSDGTGTTIDAATAGQIKVTNSDRGSVAVAAHVGQADPHTQYLLKTSASQTIMGNLTINGSLSTNQVIDCVGINTSDGNLDVGGGTITGVNNASLPGITQANPNGTTGVFIDLTVEGDERVTLLVADSDKLAATATGGALSGVWAAPTATGGTNTTQIASTAFVVAEAAAATAVGKTLRVDSVGGNNSTGTRGQWNLPYLTLAAARTAATAGDTIFVGPGTYGGLTLKDAVNWHLDPGTVVAQVTDGGAACTSRIGGHGSIAYTGTTGGAVLVVNASTSLTGCFASVFSGAVSGTAAGVQATAGRLDLTIYGDVVSVAYDAMVVVDARVHLRCRDMIAPEGSEPIALEGGGSAVVFAAAISGDSAVICENATADASLTVYADSLTSTNGIVAIDAAITIFARRFHAPLGQLNVFGSGRLTLFCTDVTVVFINPSVVVNGLPAKPTNDGLTYSLTCTDGALAWAVGTGPT